MNAFYKIILVASFALGCAVASDLPFEEHYLAANKHEALHDDGRGNVTLRLEFWGSLPSDSLIEPYRELFHQEKRVTIEKLPYDAYVYEYPLPTPQGSCFNDERIAVTKIGDDYHFFVDSIDEAQRLQFDPETVFPHHYTLAEARTLIASSRLVILAGPAVSTAAGLTTREEFTRLVGIDRNHLVDGFVETLFRNPEQLQQQFAARCAAAFSGSPTSAHLAIAALVKELNCAVYNLNYDRILEKAGVTPIDIFANTYSLEPFENADLVLCIGCGTDYKGFLGYFKKVNPSGKILAIDLVQPEYLSDDDILLQGDLNEILPQLVQKG